jgi:RNA polymerase sigma factor (sigma-70 family)
LKRFEKGGGIAHRQRADRTAYQNTVRRLYGETVLFLSEKDRDRPGRGGPCLRNGHFHYLSAAERDNPGLLFRMGVEDCAQPLLSLGGEEARSKPSVSGTELDESVSDNTSVEDDYVFSEEKSLLRRELAFIASDYRNIVVSYYIDDRNLKDIATSLNLPEGTVKTRLFKARKLLKEGMNMAREFGVRSYKPEEIKFSASGNQPNGLPWKAVERKVTKNILLQASNNPSTLEELSVELGIALPYMEEEVKLLTDATLLKKVEGSKYITNFFIADRECQMAVYQAQRRSSTERSDMLIKS